MKTTIGLLATLLLISAVAVLYKTTATADTRVSSAAVSHRPELELLVDYLGLSERQLVKAVERLVADGKYELAASLLESTGNRFHGSASVANAKRLVYLKLMEKNQNTDPFKFIVYSGQAAEQIPQLAAAK